MPTADNCLTRSKTFLAKNSSRLALRAVPLALAAAAVAHATPNFNGPSTAQVLNCPSTSGGSLGATLTGIVVNGGHGLSMSGTGTFSDPSNAGCAQFQWQGTGTGSFDSASLPVLWDFTITPPGNVSNVSWTLVFKAASSGGNSTTNFFCGQGFVAAARRLRTDIAGTFTGLPCSGSISGRGFAMNTPVGNVISWEVDLLISATWNNGNATTLTLNVPPASSININAPLGATVPTLTPLALSITAIGLLALAGMMFSRRRAAPAGSGSHPPPL